MANATLTPHIHQIERHPGFAQTAMVDYCQKHNIHLQAYAPLGDADRQSRSGPPVGAILAADPVVAAAKAHSCSAAQVLLLWQLQNGHSSTPRVMTNNQQHMKELLDALAGSISPLTASEMSAIDAIAEGLKCWPTVGSCPENTPKLA